MSVEQKMAAVDEWQNSNQKHPLTCGNDSKHRVLVGIRYGNNVHLVCLDCTYCQRWVPKIVYESWMKRNNGKPVAFDYRALEQRAWENLGKTFRSRTT